MRFYNTLTRRKEELDPLEPGRVRIYTCGPTVYRRAHIGNMRSYLMVDWIRRALEQSGIRVIHIKNITDVGHMRQEMLDRGEDKVIAAARAAGKSAKEIAAEYTELFYQDEASLGILPAYHYPKATEHILEMQDIVVRLLERGYAYEVDGNVYFEISKFESYGKLSGNLPEGKLLEGVRAEAEAEAEADPDPLKKDPRDFALWKAAEPERELKWPSPWGDGFPGWHIECSAMSTKYLGERFDIHTGGVDNIFPHHEGEIAQSEAAFGHQVVSIWIHGEHLLADGVKMAKSTGNSYSIDDLSKGGIDPLALRYLCLTARYRNRLNFTFSSLKAAQRAYLRLKNRVWEWSSLSASIGGSSETEKEWRNQFWKHIEDDLDCPKALALTWKLVRSNLPDSVKHRLLLDFDKFLGLRLDKSSEEYKVPANITILAAQRSNLRERGEYKEADDIRARLEREGYRLEDTPISTRIRPKTKWERHEEAWKTVSSSKEVSSLIDEPETLDFSVGIVACNYQNDVKRLIDSVLFWSKGYSAELVVVDNGSSNGTGRWLEDLAQSNNMIRVIHIDHVIGEASAKNIVLKQCRGRNVFLLDTSAEVTGDIFASLQKTLSDDTVGLTGPFGLITQDLRQFDEVADKRQDVDAMQGYCFAFRRSLLREVGMMRETFRFYRNLDIEYSFHFKDKGYKIVADPSLPVTRHEHRVWTALSEEERDKLSTKNFSRFLDRWGQRYDLLVGQRKP